MKKLGFIKKMGLTATVVFLCLAMMLTCFTFTTPFFRAAYAEDAPVTANASVFAGAAVKDTVDYGGTIEVPDVAGSTVTYIAPDGEEKPVENGEVKATQIGVYKIRYTNAGISYDFNVKSTLDKEYFLYIAYNGADIPTYIKSGDKFTLPAAEVMYYDDDKVLTPYPGNAPVEVEDSRGNKYNVGEGSTTNVFTAGENGKVFVTYTARLEDGSKYFTKTFTVNIQSDINKSGNPQLSVSGIQKDASVNRPVTLPVAKATDNNDDNIKVVIEVLGPKADGSEGVEPVKMVEVNDDGYAVATKDKNVIFDNDKSMTFYPTRTGKYKVTYTAYNDFYDAENPTAGGKSGTNEFTITVADHVAPVFKNVEEYRIPETWGSKTVKNKDGVVSGAAGKITFTVPDVVDNKDRVTPDGDDDTDLISMYFRITDSDNSRTVLEVKNILTDGDDSKVKAKDDSVYKTDIEFNKAHPFTFDLAEYDRKDAKGEPAVDKNGTYTVLFRARDKSNNTSSKTYTITVKDTYEDTAAPSTAEVTAPEYLSGADETFTVPHPTYADASDTRPQVEYRIYTDATLGANDSRYITVKGGETADLTEKEGYVVVDKDKSTRAELKLGNNLYFYVGVKDKVGNFKSNAEDLDFAEITDERMETETLYTKVESAVKVIGNAIGDFTVSLKATPDTIDFANANGNTEIKANDNVVAGKFSIETASNDTRYYTGFEVAVYDPQGNPVNVTLETVSVPGESKSTIYVQNIRFNAAVATAEDKPYKMTVRVFDVNGKNEVYGYTLSGVKTNAGNGNQTSSTPVIGSTGNVNKKYKLNNSVIKGLPSDDTYYVVRKISGGIFALMGNEFTAKTQGSYSVQDGYISKTVLESTDGKAAYEFDFDKQVNFSGANEGVYNFSITDEAAPVIEMQGKMPVYENKFDPKKGITDSDSSATVEPSKGNGLIEIPNAVAVTENGMGVVEIEVTDPDSKDVDLDKETNTFVATKDGTYTVKYTATYGNASAVTATYYISVGDVFAPVFTTKGGTSTSGTKKQDDVFTFATIELAEGESDKGVTVKKEIYDPSHEVMSSHTVRGSYSGYRDKKNNGSDIKLSMVGDYTIVYTVTDAVGNEYKLTEKITVANKGSGTATTWTTLSTVLIIVAIVLLAGVIVYVVRFRKVKK